MALTAADLSLEQAPPISVPFRFFLLAPLFGALAGLLVLVAGPEMLVNRWSPAVLAFTHLWTLGFIALVMCGALMQMLPVLAGAPLPGVLWVARVVNLFLVLGTLALVSSFLSAERGWMWVAMGLLGSGFLVFVVAVITALRRVRMPNTTVVGMGLAVVCLLVTVGFGLYLGSGFSGLIAHHNMSRLVDLHLGWGFLGWVGLLLVAVAYQVVPMFQVTPDYPAWIRRLLIGLPFLGLVSWMPLQWALSEELAPPALASLWLGLFAGAYPLFAAYTLVLQARRRRKVPDNTLSFWRYALIVILASYLLWLSAQLSPQLAESREYPLILGLGMLFSAISLVSGMLYKIVPFLSWFHLQHRQVRAMCFDVQIPNMKEFLPDAPARLQLRLHLLAGMIAVVAILGLDWLARPAGLLLLLSSLLLGYNLALAMRRYHTVSLALAAAVAAKTEETGS